MKNSSDWIRQEHVDATADRLLSEGPKRLEELKAYQVANALGVEPNSSIYEKFKDWMKRKKADIDNAKIDVPAPMVAALMKSLQEEANARQSFLIEMVRSMASSYNASADLRVAAAYRQAEQANAMEEDVLESLRKLEGLYSTKSEENASRQREIEALKSERSELKGILTVCGPLLERIQPAQSTLDDIVNTDEDQPLLL